MPDEQGVVIWTKGNRDACFASRCYDKSPQALSVVVRRKGGPIFMKKLKDVRTITTCALLLALATILGFFKIPITQIIEIRFGALPVAVAGAFFGPVLGGIVGGLADILAYIVKPTGPFFPGFTISSAIGGVIFGLILYSKGRKPTILRIFLAQVIYTIVVGLIINTFNLYFLYGDFAAGVNGYFVYMGTRLLKELIMLPINTVLVIGVVKPAFFIKNKDVIEEV